MDEDMKRDAARWRWLVENAKRGAFHNGMVLNPKLLNGHRDRNRMMYSFVIRAINSAESVDLPMGEAIDREIMRSAND